MAKPANIQRRELTPFQRVMRMVSRMSIDERILVVKAIAADLGDPLYTQSEMEERLRTHHANEAHQQKLQQIQRDVQEFQALLRKGY